MRARALLTAAALAAAGAASAFGPQVGEEPREREAEAKPRPVVEVGLERLEVEGARPLKGRRVGLLCHGASVTADGRHAFDVLRGLGVEVVRLFSPEHGLRGQAAAGERIVSGVDPDTGVPVVSLYGEKTRPAPEDLQDVDTLVVDLQDAGVRFYTYSSTMLLALEAAAEAGIEVVVLDRPNPLGGALVEGPASDPRDVLPASLVNMAPGPLVHGLTLGEMARYANEQRAKKAKLKVVEMRRWARSMQWTDTGRTWIPPSPNLRSPEAALAYPGTALLESVNVSEGRGTDAPFLLLGAPWLRVNLVLARVSVPGFELSPARFTPRGGPFAPEPKYRDLECAGLRVAVTRPGAVEPFTLGVALLHALRWQPEFQWLRGGAALDNLLGTRSVRQRLQRGDGVESIIRADDAAAAAWVKDRKEALLYD